MTDCTMKMREKSNNLQCRKSPQQIVLHPTLYSLIGISFGQKWKCAVTARDDDDDDDNVGDGRALTTLVRNCVHETLL